MLRVIVITNTDCLENSKQILQKQAYILNSSKTIYLKLIFKTILTLIPHHHHYHQYSSASFFITNINQPSVVIPESNYLYLVSFLNDYDNHHYHHCVHYHYISIYDEGMRNYYL